MMNLPQNSCQGLKPPSRSTGPLLKSTDLRMGQTYWTAQMESLILKMTCHFWIDYDLLVPHNPHMGISQNGTPKSSRIGLFYRLF